VPAMGTPLGEQGIATQKGLKRRYFHLQSVQNRANQIRSFRMTPSG
jgi:hypothetical protein